MKENFKYWILGNFISFIVGFQIVLLFILLHEFFPELTQNIMNNRLSPYIILCSGTLIGGLTVKVIKKNLPWYIYSTTGIIYIVTLIFNFFSLVSFVERIKELATYEQINLTSIFNAIKFSTLNSSLNSIPEKDQFYLILSTIIFSFCGGFIAKTYRNIKNKSWRLNLAEKIRYWGFIKK